MKEPRTRSHLPGTDPFDDAAVGGRFLEPGWLVPATVPPKRRARAAASGRGTWARSLRSRLQGTTTDPAPTAATLHPLQRSALLQGMPAAERDLLTQRFRAATPQAEWSSRQAALSHLETLLPVWGMREWRAVRGMHVLVGIAGSGRKTMLFKMARHIRAAGRQVGAIALFPSQAHQARAFLAAADGIGISAAVAATEDAWGRTVETFAACDTILVHTPCLLSDAGTARRLRRIASMRNASTHVHHVVSLHHAPRSLARQVQQIQVLGADFRAVAQADLAPGPGALFGLQLQHRMPLSVVNRDAWMDGDLVPFGVDAILESLLRTID